MNFATVLERLQRVENPYPGLRPFETTESHLFFGRDQQVADLITRLERNRFLAVVGVSGSGKSSLIRAGLIPALERTFVGEAGTRWRAVVSRPAGRPLATLSTDLTRAGLDSSRLEDSSHGLILTASQLPTAERLLLVIDQFEELFRYKELIAGLESHERKVEASEAAEFFQLLINASRHHPPVYIVLTMRSDYLGDCAEFRDLSELLNDCQYLVPRLTRQQRKEAIKGPLGRVQIASSLVERLLNDAGDEPDQLSVLQHALKRTWDHWRKDDPEQRRAIELRDYETIGGFGNALNNHADELLAGVSSVIANKIFKRLTAKGPSNRERRDPATLAELWAVCGAVTSEEQMAVSTVVNHFREFDAAFLAPIGGTIVSETYVDIVHESLIRLWRKLRDEWLPEEQKSAKTFLDLVEKARNWMAGRGETLRGLDLTEAVEWRQRCNPSQAWASHYAKDSSIESVFEFIRTSQSEERKRMRRAKRNLWIAICCACLFALVASFAWYQWGQAREANRTARSATTVAEEAESKAQNRLRLLSDGMLVRRAIFSGDLGLLPADRLNRQVRFIGKRVPLGYVDTTGREIYDWSLAPDAQSLRTGLDGIAALTYRMDHPTFKQKLYATGRDTKFEFTYTGWGCLTRVLALIEYSNPEVLPEIAEFNMCDVVLRKN